MKALALSLVRFYQLTLSRVMASSCRFAPSCSQYAYESIQRYGVIRGGWMAAKRLARCHPWHEGGYDPVG